MIKKLMFFSIIILLFGGCKKDPAVNSDYFIIGSYYGECMGDCAILYKAENGKLYADNVKWFHLNVNSSILKFDDSPLSNDKFILVDKLKNNLPNYLINNPSKTFGCPDCADQGGMYIEIRQDGKVIFWNIDTGIASLPKEIKNYITQCKELLEQLAK